MNCACLEPEPSAHWDCDVILGLPKTCVKSGTFCETCTSRGYYSALVKWSSDFRVLALHTPHFYYRASRPAFFQLISTNCSKIPYCILGHILIFCTYLRLSRFGPAHERTGPCRLNGRRSLRRLNARVQAFGDWQMLKHRLFGHSDLIQSPVFTSEPNQAASQTNYY
jgi:hypothetical protein